MKVSDISYDSVLSLEYSLKQITDAELNSAKKQLPQLTPAQAKLEISRADKWQDMISKQYLKAAEADDSDSLFSKILPTPYDKVKSRARKGIPRGIRPLVYPQLAHVDSLVPAEYHGSTKQWMTDSSQVPLSRADRALIWSDIQNVKQNRFPNWCDITDQHRPMFAVLKCLYTLFLDMHEAKNLLYLADIVNMLLQGVCTADQTFAVVYALVTNYQLIPHASDRFIRD